MTAARALQITVRATVFIVVFLALVFLPETLANLLVGNTP